MFKYYKWKQKLQCRTCVFYLLRKTNKKMKLNYLNCLFLCLLLLIYLFYRFPKSFFQIHKRVVPSKHVTLQVLEEGLFMYSKQWFTALNRTFCFWIEDFVSKENSLSKWRLARRKWDPLQVSLMGYQIHLRIVPSRQVRWQVLKQTEIIYL